MALDYNSNNKFVALAPVLEDYAEWFANIATLVAYHDEGAAKEVVTTPQSFQEWLSQAQKDESIQPVVIEMIIKTYEDMVQVGASVLAEVKSGRKPSQQVFKDFKNLYAAFLSRIRRLEMDNVIDGSGMDEETGLRHLKTIKADLKREMERLTRQGNPFSLVMCRIDKFVGQDNQKAALEIASRSIKKCMRSFDDAYYLSNGHFLISLKHADIIGAQAAVGRLQQNLKEDESNRADKIMTMSYCIAEPVPGDVTDELLNNMQGDLTDHLNDTDAVLKFLEISNLERFVHSME